MPLFTVILDYKGGTYISQASGRTPKAALRNWANTLEAEPIEGLAAKSKGVLLAALRGDGSDDYKPVVLQGLRNAWCTSVLVRGDLALLNIVKTDVR